MTDSLRLKANKGRLQMLFGGAVIFLVITIFAFPLTLFGLIFRALVIPACLFGMVVFAVGIFTNRYDAVLDRNGIEVGKFIGRKHFKWTEIGSVLVINATSGKEVLLEFREPISRLYGHLKDN